MKKLSFAFFLMLALVVASPALADYGYENTISDCASHVAWTDAMGTTLEIYMMPVEATPTSITLQFIPSFDLSDCTVKTPIGYTVFDGVSVKMTSDITTPVGDEEVQIILNDDASGELEYTFTDLDPATEYQFRVDGLFETIGGTPYTGSVSDNVYYATSTDQSTNFAIASDGVLSWTWAEGTASNIKADVAFYDENDEQIVSTVKYKTSDGEYDYYDFANQMYNGNYYATLTTSTKKIYDLVDHRIWATPVTLYFTTVNGVVVSSSYTPQDEEEEIVLTSPTQKPVIKKAGVKTGIVMKKAPSYYGEGYYYKFVFYKKKGKNTAFTWNNVTTKNKSISKKQKTKLKNGISKGQAKYRYVRAKLCNSEGCGPWSKYKKFKVKKS
ncbi:MAG: hypothetical protein V1898_00625 [Patescibacteria group bacterium]